MLIVFFGMTLASFYRHVSVTNDEVTAMLGGVKLQMVSGNIIHETTDAIINTTDFSNSQSGMIDGFYKCFDCFFKHYLGEIPL